MNKHQEFWVRFDKADHVALAIWAAACAEHVLPLFEDKYPQDPRPRAAIATLREWIETAEFSMPVIRGASLAAHAAARETREADAAARFAARAAGQAAATAHVPTHALGPALYALKAIASSVPADRRVAAVVAELDWQDRLLPDDLREWVHAQMEQGGRLLPKDLRDHLRARSKMSG